MKTEIKVLINDEPLGKFTVKGSIGIEEIALLADGLLRVLKDKFLKGEERRDWQSDREDYLAGKPNKECHYCGFDYQDPKYCSVWGRTADEHEWI